MKTLYTAHAVTKGGRNGRSQTTDGKLSLELAPPGVPTQKQGPVTNPEELFACGYSACFGSAIDFIAKQKKLSVGEISVNADVSLNSDESSGFSLGVVLNVDLPGMDAAAAQELVQAAHQVCPYSKATRNNVKVELKVNNQPLNMAA